MALGVLVSEENYLVLLLYSYLLTLQWHNIWLFLLLAPPLMDTLLVSGGSD